MFWNLGYYYYHARYVQVFPKYRTLSAGLSQIVFARYKLSYKYYEVTYQELLCSNISNKISKWNKWKILKNRH